MSDSVEGKVFRRPLICAWFLSREGMLDCIHSYLSMQSNQFSPLHRFLQNLTLGVWMEAVEQESGSRRSDLLLYVASVVFVLLATCFKATYQAVVR
jgi:hypothetical protein